MKILCKLGIHKWAYDITRVEVVYNHEPISHHYESDKRHCLRCGITQFHMGDEGDTFRPWRTVNTN